MATLALPPCHHGATLALPSRQHVATLALPSYQHVATLALPSCHHGATLALPSCHHGATRAHAVVGAPARHRGANERAVLRPLAIAFGFLTRFPVPTGTVEAGELGRAVTWFPAVGAALGAMLAGGAVLLDGRVAPGLVSVALVALLAGATGGLHLDGLADVFDALGGGRGSRDRMLAIMRDSRIGAHGAAALVLLLAAKLAAVVEIVGRAGPHRIALWPLFAAPVAARWAVGPLVVWFPYARPEGLGKPFHGHAGVAQLAGATVVTAIAISWFGPPALIAALAALGTTLGVALWLYRRLGGLTGDVYGAATELAELAFLVAAGGAAR